MTRVSRRNLMLPALVTLSLLSSAAQEAAGTTTTFRAEADDPPQRIPRTVQDSVIDRAIRDIHRTDPALAKQFDRTLMEHRGAANRIGSADDDIGFRVEIFAKLGAGVFAVLCTIAAFFADRPKDE